MFFSPLLDHHLSGPEVRMLEVFGDEPLHLVLGAGVQVLVPEPHPEQHKANMDWKPGVPNADKLLCHTHEPELLADVVETVCGREDVVVGDETSATL